MSGSFWVSIAGYCGPVKDVVFEEYKPGEHACLYCFTEAGFRDHEVASPFIRNEIASWCRGCRHRMIHLISRGNCYNMGLIFGNKGLRAPAGRMK